MQRTNSLQILCYISLILLALCFAGYNVFFAHSLDKNPLIINATSGDDNPEITILDIGDKLYKELLFERDGEYPEDISNITNPLRQNDFNSITTLDLSGRYLTYIGGLAYFKFDNLQFHLDNFRLV